MEYDMFSFIITLNWAIASYFKSKQKVWILRCFWDRNLTLAFKICRVRVSVQKYRQNKTFAFSQYKAFNFQTKVE